MDFLQQIESILDTLEDLEDLVVDSYLNQDFFDDELKKDFMHLHNLLYDKCNALGLLFEEVKK